MANFDISYKRTSLYEGGYANVSGDKGGETYAGISRKFHPNWKGWKIIDSYKPLKWNQIINNTELKALVKEFYLVNFWNPIKGSFYNSQIIADFIYDYAVHSGISRACKKLQTALGFKTSDIDGKIGPQTLLALNNASVSTLLTKLKDERRNFLIALSKQPGQSKFKTGWVERVNSFKL